MKILKGILLSLAVALVAFIVYSNLNNADEVISPIPDKSGVKVIKLSPTK